MPLPKISTPTYELEIPSTKKKIRYRPFLVKEEKIIIIAMESQSDTEIEEIDEQIAQEIKDGILPDPNSVDPITGEPLEGGGGDLGDVPVEDDLESQGQVTDAQLSNDTKKAEI